MPYQITEFQTTPNPNALKCVLDRSPAPNGPRSYFTASDAASDPLGAALFAVAGVANILVHDGWITVGKSPDADWKVIKPQVTKALAEAP